MAFSKRKDADLHRHMKRIHESKKKSRKWVWALYAIFAVLILSYAVVNNVFLGIAAFLFIVIILAAELSTSVKTEGISRSVMDVVIAIVVAVVVWVVLVLSLHTTAPIDAVASCSMLPTLHRGDLVLLHGITNITAFITEYNVPVINVNGYTVNKTLDSMQTEFLAFYGYNGNNESQIFQMSPVHDFNVALYSIPCLSSYTANHEESDYYKCVVTTQANNLIKYNYAIGNVTLNGTRMFIVYTSSIQVGNTTIADNYSNPIIVYKTTGLDYFSGDIIHRLFAVIRAGNQYYFLTMGDNNPSLDIEFDNYPATQSQVLGYVTTDVPIIGYVKLILQGQLGAVPGCNQVIKH